MHIASQRPAEPMHKGNLAFDAAPLSLRRTEAPVSGFRAPTDLGTPRGEIEAAPAVKIKSYARTIHLQIVDPKDLSLSKMVSELLDLNSTQVEHVNGSLARFVERLRQEEVVHASIVMGPNGGEEIVIAAFDRGKLVRALRDEVSTSVDSDVASFIADQLAFDGTLAIANAETRVAIQSAADGADRLSFTRQIQQPEAVDEYTPYSQGGIVFAATSTHITEGLLEPTILSRFSHLFAAEQELRRREGAVVSAPMP